MKSLGLFALVVLMLLILACIYFLMKKLDNKHRVFEKIKVKLKQKLFFSSFLRYMIVSNIKLNYTIWAFLIGSGSFTTIASSLATASYIVSIIGLCVWPIYIAWFMIKNQH